MGTSTLQTLGSTANREGDPNVTCLPEQAVPETTTPGGGDVGMTMLTVGRAPAGGGGVGAEGLADQGACDLPEVPQPLHREGPHAAPGATAVLVGAASAGERAQAGQRPGQKGRARHEIQADGSADRAAWRHFAKRAKLTAVSLGAHTEGAEMDTVHRFQSTFTTVHTPVGQVSAVSWWEGPRPKTGSSAVPPEGSLMTDGRQRAVAPAQCPVPHHVQKMGALPP